MNDKFAEIQSAANSGAFGINGYALPSVEQCRAGNYRKGRVTLYGLNIAIETPQGTRRMGKSDGNPWSVICMAHYGDISGTVGADGDPVDCYVGPVPESDRVFVVNQNGKTGEFDEHKVMLAFADEDAARTAYMNSYEPGWTGLGSMVSASVDQFTWWLRYGNTALPFSKTALPYHGDDDMNELQWDSAALPVNTDLVSVLYGMRRDDPDKLLLDAVTLADIHEDADALEILDALVIESQKLEPKLTQLQRIMEAAGGQVKPVAMQISQPFKQKGTTNVTALYELSDGQTVAIFFHNPDSTPNKILPTDELVSWKWLLNKLDVTILVAPERGRDLNPREVARRIMALAEKNSAKFTKANGARAERMAALEQAKADVSGKESTLAALEAEIADLTVKVEAKRAIQPPTPGDEQGGKTGETFLEMARRLVPNEFKADTDPDGFTAIAEDGYGIRLRMTAGGRMLTTYIIQPGVTGQNSLGSKSVATGLESAMAGSVSTAVTYIGTYRARSQPLDILQLAEAMKKVDTDGMWYNDPVVNELVNRAKEQGLAFRNSTTQAGWTTAGIEALKAARAAQAPVIDWTQAQELATNAAIRSLGVARINDIGSENVYVEKDGQPFMFKPGNTDAYAIGEHDFSNDPTFAEPEHQGDPILVQFGTSQTSASSITADRDAWMRKNIPAEQLDTDGDEGVGSATLAPSVIRNLYRTNDGQLAYWDMDSRAFLSVSEGDSRLTFNQAPAPSAPSRLDWDEALYAALEARELSRSDAQGVVEAQQEAVDAAFAAGTDPADVAAQLLGGGSDDNAAEIAGVEAILKSTNWVKRSENTWDRGAWHLTIGDGAIQVSEYQEGELVERGTVALLGDEGGTVKAIEDIVAAGAAPQLTPDEQADAAEQAKYQPFDRSKLKLPTAKQLGMGSMGKIIVFDDNGKKGWSNGTILDLKRPKLITDAIAKYYVDDSSDSLRKLGMNAVDRVIPKDAALPLEPIADYNSEGVDMESLAKAANGALKGSGSSKDVKAAAINAVILANQEAGKAVQVDTRLFAYFDKIYKQPEYYVGRDGLGAVLVKKAGQIIGVISPMNGSGDALKRAARAAGVDGDVTPVAAGWETNGLGGLMRRDTLTRESAGNTYTLTVGGQFGSGYWFIEVNGKQIASSPSGHQSSFASLRAKGLGALQSHVSADKRKAELQAENDKAAGNEQKAVAIQMLQSVIDGTAEMDAGLADRMQAVHEQFTGDAEFDALFEQAAQVFADAMVAKARAALAA